MSTWASIVKGTPNPRPCPNTTTTTATTTTTTTTTTATSTDPVDQVATAIAGISTAAKSKSILPARRRHAVKGEEACIVCRDEVTEPECWVTWPCGHELCGSCNISYLEFNLGKRDSVATSVKCPTGFCDQMPSEREMAELIGNNVQLLTVLQTRVRETQTHEVTGAGVRQLQGGERSLKAVNALDFRGYLQSLVENDDQRKPDTDIRKGLCWRCADGWEARGVAHASECMCAVTTCTCKALNEEHAQVVDRAYSAVDGMKAIPLSRLQDMAPGDRLEFGSALGDFLLLMAKSKDHSVAELGKYLQSVDTRACPFCLNIIERWIGCNHMSCTRCLKSFDWATVSVSPGPNVLQALQVSERERQAQVASVRAAYLKASFGARVSAIHAAGKAVKAPRTDLLNVHIPPAACTKCFSAWEREQEFNHAILCKCNCQCGSFSKRLRESMPAGAMKRVVDIMVDAGRQAPGVLPWMKSGNRAPRRSGKRGRAGKVQATA